jgi:hypothetical protein
MEATQTQETKTYSGKKALVLYGEDYSQKKEINIYDELEYKHRIIEELAGMSLENDPVLNCKEELKGIPLVYWSKEAWENKTHTEINEILEKKEEEFDELLSELIIEQMPEFKTKEGDYLCFHEFYNTSKEDNANNIFLRFTVDKYNDSETEEASNLEDLFSAQNEITTDVETVIPDFKDMIDNAKEEGIKEIIIHQDAFAADYQIDEYVILGKAIKYAGMKGISVKFYGTNRETLN